MQNIELLNDLTNEERDAALLQFLRRTKGITYFLKPTTEAGKATTKPAEPLTASSAETKASTQAEAPKNVEGDTALKTEANDRSSELNQEQSVVSDGTIEHQLGVFNDTWQSAVAHAPLEATVNQICNGLQAIVSHAVEDMEHEFDPFLWPIIEGMTQVAYDAEGDELDDAVMDIFFEFGPRIIRWISEDIEAYLERVKSSNMKLDPSTVSQSNGAQNG